MLLGRVFERFVQKTPVTVMFRGILENALSEDEAHRVFVDNAELGHERKLWFSEVVEMTSLVVARIQPKIHAAYGHRSHEPIRMPAFRIVTR